MAPPPLLHVQDISLTLGGKPLLAGADFVKTSTGFAGTGATVEAVSLLRRLAGKTLGVKASGGIRTLDQALALIEAGADRLGLSATPAVLAEWDERFGNGR